MQHSHINFDDTNVDKLSYSAFCGHGTNKQDIQKRKQIMYEALVHELTDRQRECVILYYIDNMKMKDIADKLEITPSTVTRHIKSGIKRLQNLARYY